jgi:hypothetical protein
VKILKVLVFGLVGVLVLLLLVGFFMPKSWKVQRRITIDAPPAAVHAHIADLSRWPEWMPWMAEDPKMTLFFEGERTTVGSVMRWHSEKMGDGALTLTRSAPAQGIGYDLMMKEFDEPAHGSIALVPDGANAERTRVTWIDEGNVGANPFMRLAVPLLEAMLGTYFDRGLATLERNVEAQK